ncbi:MAG: PAS domain-containing protein [Desulfovibrio sp.]|jgi:PAS domain S-box-containing protein|nr:PAS domain-containing protein [Desulfovibrio sp.]
MTPSAPEALLRPGANDADRLRRAARIGMWRVLISSDQADFAVDEVSLDLLGVQAKDIPSNLLDFCARFVHPADMLSLLEAVQDARVGDALEMELRLMDGRTASWRQVSLFGSAAAGEKGCLILSGGVQAVPQARVETIRRLEETQCRLQSILTTAKLGSWDYSLASGTIHVDRMFADLADRGFPDAQDAAALWQSLILPEDQASARAALEAHIREGTPFYETEFRILRGDGSTRHWLCRGRILDRNEEGLPLSCLGTVQDITEVRETYRELASSRGQLDILANKIGLGIWDWHPREDALLLHESFFLLLGYPAEEMPLAPMDWKDLLHPEDRGPAVEAREAVAAGSLHAYDLELRVRNRDGRYLWLRDMGRPVEWDKEGRICRVVGCAMDISPSKAREQELCGIMETVASQNEALAETIQERTVLLRGIQRRLDGILAGVEETPAADDAAAPVTASSEIWEGWEDLDRLGATSTNSFTSSLNDVFDLITEKMWWYKCIIDSIPFPVSVTDKEERWTYLNTPALEVVGAQSLQEVLGIEAKPWWSEDSNREMRLQDADTETGRIFTRHHTRLNRFFQGQTSRLFDKGGNHAGFVEVMQDVTMIHEADERVHIMLDATPLACIFWDAEGHAMDCNLAAPRLFNLESKQECLDRYLSLSPEVQPNGEKSEDLAARYQAAAFKEGFQCFEWTHQRLDGTLIPAEITQVRVRYGKENLLVSYIRDLTELKAKAAEVDKERRLLVQVMQSSPVCFVILVDGIIRFATPYAMNFFDINIGSPVSKFYRDDLARTLFFREMDQIGAINWKAVSVEDAGGNAREMLANAYKGDYYGEACIMAWFLDVTEMREKERELSLARDVAEESARAKGDFLANMSHEIRTPRNAIMGMTHLVLESELTRQQREYLEKAENSAKSLLRIINDILDFSKIEAGRLEMEIVDFSLPSVLQSVVDMFREIAAAKGLSLTLSLPDGLPVNLRGDPLRLTQIFTNLTGNAIKFTERGSITLGVTLLEISESSTVLEFSVRDTGIGLSEGQLDRLFTAFTQADSSTTRRYGGTGLGLIISKRLVEMMHGNIFCVSAPGEGSEFTFTARFELGHPQEEAESSDALRPGGEQIDNPEEIVATMAGRRILVAEDNEINQIIIQEILEKPGLVVELAYNGLQALEMARSGRYDLIFMDIQMPEMDGLTATREIRKIPSLSRLPIVAMTAHAMVGDKEKSLEAGMNDHIAKPIDVHEVFTKIVRWMPQEKSEEHPVPEEKREEKLEEKSAAPLPQPVAAEPSPAGAAERIPEPPAPAFGAQSVRRQGHFPRPAPRLPAARTRTAAASPAFSAPRIIPSDMPGMAFSEGLKQLHNNRQLYIKLLARMSVSLPELRSQINECIMVGDLSSIKEIAQAITASAGKLGLTDMHEAAERLALATDPTTSFSILFLCFDALEQTVDRFLHVTASLRE